VVRRLEPIRPPRAHTPARGRARQADADARACLLRVAIRPVAETKARPILRWALDIETGLLHATIVRALRDSEGAQDAFLIQHLV